MSCSPKGPCSSPIQASITEREFQRSEELAGTYGESLSPEDSGLYDRIAFEQHRDWQLVWSLMSDEEFCKKYQGQYDNYAVYGGRMLGVGTTDQEARNMAMGTLALNGITYVPKEALRVGSLACEAVGME